MNIAFDMSFTQSISNKRGIGQYTRNLIETIKKLDDKNNYFYYYPKKNNEKTYRNSDLIMFLSKNSIDIFHITSPFEFKSDYATLLSRGIKVVVTLFDLIPFLYPNIYLIDKNTKDKYFETLHFIKSCDLIFAISETTKNDAINILGIDPQKIIVIMGGIDEKFTLKQNLDIDLLKRKYNIAQPYILFSGGIEYRKNLARFLEAFSRFPNLVNQFQIVFFNDLNTNEILQINNLASGLGVQKNIVLTGFVPIEELVEIYNGAELFVFPSLYEGLGLPVLEAMACGVPVLTSNTSSLKEISGDSAYNVNPEDVEEIANGLKIMLGDKHLTEKLKVRGLNHVKQFNWEITGKKVLNAYRQLSENIDNNSNEKKIGKTLFDLMKLNNEQFLHQLYKELLNREPDQYGFEQHLRNLSRGVKKITIISNFLLSEEAKSIYTNPKTNDFHHHTILNKLAKILKLNNKNFIFKVYEELLNREPSAFDLELNLYKLNNGTSKIHLFVYFLNRVPSHQLGSV
jgi:glycosyltransferase involved in cell wall biosynthesis